MTCGENRLEKDKMHGLIRGFKTERISCVNTDYDCDFFFFFLLSTDWQKGERWPAEFCHWQDDKKDQGPSQTGELLFYFLSFLNYFNSIFFQHVLREEVFFFISISFHLVKIKYTLNHQSIIWKKKIYRWLHLCFNFILGNNTSSHFCHCCSR